MPTKRRFDLECEALTRCVAALKLRNYKARDWQQRSLRDTQIIRILRYLALRFGVTL